jgi:hypothetical protein
MVVNGIYRTIEYRSTSVLLDIEPPDVHDAHTAEDWD